VTDADTARWDDPHSRSGRSRRAAAASTNHSRACGSHRLGTVSARRPWKKVPRSSRFHARLRFSPYVYRGARFPRSTTSPSDRGCPRKADFRSPFSLCTRVADLGNLAPRYTYGLNLNWRGTARSGTFFQGVGERTLFRDGDYRMPGVIGGGSRRSSTTARPGMRIVPTRRIRVCHTATSGSGIISHRPCSGSTEPICG